MMPPIADNRRKVAFIVWSLADTGGSERVVYDIVRNLDQSRFSSIIISFEDGPARRLYEQRGVKTFCIKKTRKIDLKFIRQLRAILLDERIEITNPHHFGPFLYTFLATRFSRIKIMYTEHSRWQLEQLPLFKKIANRFFLGQTDAVVAISNQIRDYYLNHLAVSRKRVHLIHNGIDIAAFENRGDNGVRGQIGIEKQEVVIGIVANIRPEKNHTLLISAFSALIKTRPNMKLLIIGQDYMHGEVHAYANRLGLAGKVIFLGKRQDIPALLHTIDIFCLPSHYEGLPLTVLEALAAGVPVIGADVLGINEVIKNNINGILFPCNNREALVKGFRMLMEDDALRRRLAASGKVFVKEQYSLERMIAQYEQLFTII